MEVEERKQEFVKLLNELLLESDGIKKQLAQRLGIKPSTLTSWLQGKIDPASLDLLVFQRLAQVSKRSTDELAILFEIRLDASGKRLNKFKNLIQDLLSNQSQEQLGKKIGVTYGAIGGWISPQSSVDPRRISIETIAGLAQQKGWTLEKLLDYLGLTETSLLEEDLLTKIQSLVMQLSLGGQIKHLNWLFKEFEGTLESLEKSLSSTNNTKKLKKPSKKKVLLVLENEDLSLASRYSSNLVRHLQLEPENIEIATIQQLPEAINSDILIFDISTADSPSIALIQDISFDGDIVVFVSEDLPENLRAGLEDKVTDVLVKPINWSSLKDKEYFR